MEDVGGGAAAAVPPGPTAWTEKRHWSRHPTAEPGGAEAGHRPTGPAVRPARSSRAARPRSGEKSTTATAAANAARTTIPGGQPGRRPSHSASSAASRVAGRALRAQRRGPRATGTDRISHAVRPLLALTPAGIGLGRAGHDRDTDSRPRSGSPPRARRARPSGSHSARTSRPGSVGDQRRPCPTFRGPRRPPGHPDPPVVLALGGRSPVAPQPGRQVRDHRAGRPGRGRDRPGVSSAVTRPAWAASTIRRVSTPRCDHHGAAGRHGIDQLDGHRDVKVGIRRVGHDEHPWPRQRLTSSAYGPRRW